ncbi:hypothetical protein [Ancylomarina sp. 16SWW S1-10-2]|uniref:hypothetical protein n=1 Tax=Ancylomarina sp. 16SWW S1-10-2 TaxID=2499681 RepID=UPI0012AD6DC3|nr:hypothetical protein [Ancylomarina sp. 16SWW S1-10-2]MRT92251.1 hypothetical protein [Ancylomarina sp. 16SWW S1-10-2]
MKQTFKLKNGEISFNDEEIIISDNAKKQYRLRILTSSIWAFFGIISVLRYMKTGDQFLLWTGLVIGILHSLILIMTFFRSTKSKIKIADIKLMNLKQRFGNNFLDIKLVGNKIRRVDQIDINTFELRHYIETNFKAN